jgi:hypothetical protein
MTKRIKIDRGPSRDVVVGPKIIKVDTRGSANMGLLHVGEELLVVALRPIAGDKEKYLKV